MASFEIQKSIEFCNKFEQSVKEAGAIDSKDIKALEKIQESLPEDSPFRRKIDFESILRKPAIRME